MTKKVKRPRIPSMIEVWKGIRKEPVPPGRTHQARDREIQDEDAENEIEHWLGWSGEDFEEYEED